MCQQRASIFQVRLLAEHFTSSVVSVAGPVLTITPATSATVVNTQVFGDLPNAISILTKPVSGDFTGNIISGNIPGNAAFNPFNFKTLTATLTTTAATADVVPVLGMTSSGHCGITPTNATAAKYIVTTYISAKAADPITLTHFAIAGMTCDVRCSCY